MIAAALRASNAVEFASKDAEGLLVVLRWDAEPADEVLLDRMLARSDQVVTTLGHDDLRERLLDDRSLAERAQRGVVAVGSVDRTFPDPFKHGDPGAPLLGRLHPSVRQPSQHALRRIAREHGLAEIRVFGSAVHADFRPDSDIDVMVRHKRGQRWSLSDAFGIRRELEAIVGRDVDVHEAEALRDPVRQRAEEQGVVLYAGS